MQRSRKTFLFLGVLDIVLLTAFPSQATAQHGAHQSLDASSGAKTYSHQLPTVDNVALVTASSSADNRPFLATQWLRYGAWNVFPPEFGRAASLGFDTVFLHLYTWETSSQWNDKLDAAVSHSLRVIVIIWPSPWVLNRAYYGDPNFAWDISAAIPLLDFLKTWDATHPGHIIAVNGLDEPYWVGPRGEEPCSANDPQSGGYTTPELIALRKLVRQRAALPIFYTMTDLDLWERQSKDATRCYHGLTYATDEAYDLVAIYHYPFILNPYGQPEYQRAEVAALLENNLALKSRKHLQTQFVFFGQSFSQPNAAVPRRMPTATEMFDLSELVARSGVATAFVWYPWRQDIYASTLASHPELWPAVAGLAPGGSGVVRKTYLPLLLTGR